MKPCSCVRSYTRERVRKCMCGCNAIVNSHHKWRHDEFAAKLFNKQQKSGKPAFSTDDAQEYFGKTYRDENRNYTYVPLPECTRPQIPKHMFSLRCPTSYELQRSVK